MNVSKCAMAKDKLCRMSRFGICEAPEEMVETCPYAKILRQLATLLIETSKKKNEE